MKKLSLLLILLLVVTGCGNKQEKKGMTIDYGEKNYKIFMPYKENIASYVLDSDLIRYDVNDIDKVLMTLSMPYFNVNDYYYQAGQYLTKDKLEVLLSNEKLNNNTITVNGEQTSHNYISYIYEQDYVDKDGKLTGMSLLLGLNKFYKNGGNISELDESTTLDIGKGKAKELVSYIHSLEGLNNLKIAVGLYLEPISTSSTSGSVKYMGINNKNDIDFKEINYEEHYATSSYVKSNDSVTYQNFKTIENYMKEQYSGLSISSDCIYMDKALIKLVFTANIGYKNDAEIMAINQSFIDEYSKLYGDDIKLELIIKMNKQTVSLLSKNGDNATVHLVEGE